MVLDREINGVLILDFLWRIPLSRDEAIFIPPWDLNGRHITPV
jgi:hypothetical protein